MPIRYSEQRMTRLALGWASATLAPAAAADLVEPFQPRLNDRERALASEILRAFLVDIEQQLTRAARAILGAAWLEPQPEDVPAEAAQQGTEQPRLFRHPAAIPAGLVAAVRARATEHGLTERLSRRPPGDPAGIALERLLGRNDPQLSVAVIEYMLDQSKRMGHLGRPALRAHEAGADAVRATIWTTAAILRQAIIGTVVIDPTHLDGALDRAAHQTISASVLAAPVSSAPSMVLAEQIQRMGALTPDHLLEILTEGEVALFLACLALMSKVAPPGSHPTGVRRRARRASDPCPVARPRIPVDEPTDHRSRQRRPDLSSLDRGRRAGGCPLASGDQRRRCGTSAAPMATLPTTSLRSPAWAAAKATGGSRLLAPVRARRRTPRAWS
ncbi:MAG: DUF2336 domain-containing protein [Alphaproteobacteria bacterium]|nr:DUF2336 domain-containing protein [Alphaproteobacteria bacterium]